MLHNGNSTTIHLACVIGKLAATQTFLSASLAFRPVFHFHHNAEARCRSLLSCQPQADFCLQPNKFFQARDLLHFLDTGRLAPEMWDIAAETCHIVTRRALNRLLENPLAYDSACALSASLGLRRQNLRECFQKDVGISLSRFLQLVRKTVIIRRHFEEGMSIRRIFAQEGLAGVDNFWRDFASHVGVGHTEIVSGRHHWLWYIFAAYERLRLKYSD
jgi:AraC-like DNA-binding protein